VSSPFELLAELPGGKGGRLPLAAYADLMTEPGRLEVYAGDPGTIGDWLTGGRMRALWGWPMPNSNRPNVFFVASWKARRGVSVLRERVARQGMVALARQLTPPAGWDPAGAGPTRPSHVGLLHHPSSLAQAIEALERWMIRRALRDSGGCKADAARRLQLSRQGLYKKMIRYGLDG